MTESLCIADLTAAELRHEIYAELQRATEGVFQLEQSWMRLGWKLAQFKASEAWRELGYGTFDEFIVELKTTYQRGRTQLYSYMGVAEKLLPLVPADKLEKIGISKALELKRALKKLDGKPLPPAVIESASDAQVTIKELRGVIATTANVDTAPETGTWYDFDGCFMTPEERKEWKEIVRVAEALLHLNNDIPEHIRRKEVLFTFAREWFGTWAHEYFGQETREGLV